jgi:hypothetical protein
VSWSSFVLGGLCGLATLSGFVLLYVITLAGRVRAGYGEDQ